jgi:hypothetical protein
MPASIPLRWIPDMPRRWREFRDGRRNLRRVPEQDSATQEIGAWLDVVLAPDGAVETFTPVRRKDQVDFVVHYRQRRRELEFWTLRAWHRIDPRDQLASEILEALQDPNESDPLNFPLSSYAAQSEIDRPDPTR